LGLTRPSVPFSFLDWYLPRMPTSAPRTLQRLLTPGALTALAVVSGWTGIYLIWQQNLVGLGLAVVTTLLAWAGLRRGRGLALKQARSLRHSLAASAARNRELERLRRLAASLLAGRGLDEILIEVTQAAADLLESESALVTLLVEEGRFLRIAAGSGPLAPVIGQLLPVDHSLSGWVALNDEPLLSENMDTDARSFRPEGTPSSLRTAAIVPLRSAGMVIGTMSVHNRRDGRPYDDDTLQLLQTLGDQVVVALDRANVLEESRRNERALALKNRELVRATLLKSQFLANMSHELRTPLNAINGFSDLLLTEATGPINPEQREFLEAVLRNGRHLLDLINSVLDLSKIEAGAMTLQLAPTDLRLAVTEAVADTASLRTARRQECSIEVDPGALVAVADGLRVKQVLINLLSNASKFTPEAGQVRLAVVRTRAPLPVPAGPTGDGTRLLSRDAIWVSVSDTGIGIRPEDTVKLFQEFSQVDSSASRQQQGTGLGLALSKRFVELHGGTIGAESVFGRGSTFWFILPVEGPLPTRTESAAAPASDER
jgi:signal transduction histidine kinase